MIHRIMIPNWRPVPDNQIAGGIHWTKRSRLKKGDKDMVAAYAHLADVPHARGKRRVSLEIVLTGRQQETDPMSYCKSLLDALVACRLLVNDTTEFVEWVPPTYSRGAVGSTTIVLEDLEVCDA